MGQNTLRDLDSHDLNDPDTINTSIMVQHESSGRLLLPDPLSTDVFPFMHLPPEIRMMIYKAYFSAANQRPQGDLQPCDVPVAILRVSKTVYAEASPIHYQEYYFVAPSSAGPFHYQYHGPPLGQLISHRELPPGSEALDFSSATEAKLVEDVSKIFTKYRKDLPKWLFGAAYVRNPLSFRSVAKPRMPGYDIARYLRQIGSQNAAEIRSLRIKMSAYRTAHSRQRCYELSLYSTIIRQHIYNVRDIVLEFGLAPQCRRHAYSYSYLHQVRLTLPSTLREALCLKHLIVRHTRNLIRDLPHVRSVTVCISCHCFPEEFLESCKADIRRAFEEKSAAAAAQERRALRNAVKGLTKPGHGG